VRRLLVLVLALVLLPSCARKPHERLNVAVSVFPIYDLVRRIAGPDADVSLVLPPGESPDGWKVTPDALSRVARARIFVSVGLGVDPWMDALREQAPPGARVLAVGDHVPTLASENGAIDGYVWMDPQRARLMATAIAEDLARADSSHAVAYRDRATHLDASLEALDKEIEARVALWPTRRVAGITPRAAYFAERYGLERETDPRATASATGRTVAVDALGGTGVKVGTYEDLIRAGAAALEPAKH